MRQAPVLVYLGLGSNLGERVQHLRRGLESLQRGGLVLRRCSQLVCGPYVGPGAPQRDYVNAVLEAETTLSPLALLELATQVEAALGRLPRTHMQPRTLDVDVLFYGGWHVWHPRLVVPHPRLAERRFVLEPLAELGVLEKLPVPGLVARLEHLRTLQAISVCAPSPYPGDRRVCAQA